MTQITDMSEQNSQTRLQNILWVMGKSEISNTKTHGTVVPPTRSR
jgi:hypothetical protein